MAKYNQIDPTFANRVMHMAEQNVQHVRETNLRQLDLKKTDLEKGYTLASLGQKLGFTVLVIAIICGTYLIGSGYQVIGTLFGVAGIAPILKFFSTDPLINQRSEQFPFWKLFTHPV